MQFMGKGKARNFFGKPSQPKPPVWLLCFRIVYSCQGRPGVPIESSALQPPERVEVIYCHLLLSHCYCLQPCSNGSFTPPSAMHGIGWLSLCWKGNRSKWAKKLLQVLHDDTKRLRRRKRVFRNMVREAGGKCQVRWGILEQPLTTYQYNHCLSKCYHSNGEDGLFSGSGLMRNGTDSLDSLLLGRRLMTRRASGKGRRSLGI